MKIIKPTRLGLLTKVFEHRREPHLTVSLLVCFPFASPRRLLYEASLWKIWGEEAGTQAILDECNPKLRGEVLVTGRCCTPGGVPWIGSSVRVQLGAVDKTLYVVGDRRWGPLGMSDPEPFTEMPITWRNAFGGEGYPQNPVGKGFAPVQLGGESVHPLPNVEDPKHLVSSARDRPTAVGFEGYDLTWPQRSSKLGTYDDAWMKNDRPGFARDFDPTYFNTAPDDQQIEGYFRGDEGFVIENMHPQKPRLEGALPGLAARCFIVQQPGEGLREAPLRLDTVRLFPHRERGILVFRGVFAVREDDARDVLQVVAACEAMGEPRPIEHYQTVLAQRLDKKRRHLFVLRDGDLLPPTPEGQDAEPLPDDQLSGLAALLKRDGKKRTALEDLPALVEQLEAERDEHEARVERKAAEAMAKRDEHHARVEREAAEAMAKRGEQHAQVEREAVEARANEQKARAERETAEAMEHARALGAKHGVDIDQSLGSAAKQAGGPPGTSMKSELEKSDRSAAEAMEQARALCAKEGIDFDQHLGSAAKGAGGPPKMSAMPELEDAGVGWQKLEQQAAEEMAQARALCAKEGIDLDQHLGSAANEAGGPPRMSAKAELEKLEDMKKLFDNAGVDSPELTRKLEDPELVPKLVAQDQALREAYRKYAHHFPAASRLEGDEAKRLREEVIAGHAAGQSFAGRDLTGADLSHLDLRGIDLEQAMLEAAALTGTDLRGGNLAGACFARADLSGADLTGAKLQGTNFGSAKLRDVKARGGEDLTGAVFAKADLSGADFTGARLSSADFSEAIFAGADFSRVTGTKIFVLRVNLSSTVLSGAALLRCTFIEVDVSDVDFSGANLSASAFITARGDGAVFRGAKLDKLRLIKDSSFAGADFGGASMAKANLMGARLSGSDFSGANLRGAVLNEADLSGATLDRAVLVEAMLIRTNLAGASLYAVDLMNAIMQKVKLPGADLEKSNLFGVDGSRMVGDAETSLSGANVKRVNFVAERRLDDQR